MNEKLLKILNDHSNGLLNDLNVELSDVANSEFQRILQDSVARMIKENKTSEFDIIDAKDAFSKFIRKMYPLNESRIGHKGIVRYQALNESKSSICPLWPIC